MSFRDNDAISFFNKSIFWFLNSFVFKDRAININKFRNKIKIYYNINT